MVSLWVVVLARTVIPKLVGLYSGNPSILLVCLTLNWREISLFINFHWCNAKLDCCVLSVWFLRKCGKIREITTLKFGFFFCSHLVTKNEEGKMQGSILLFYFVFFLMLSSKLNTGVGFYYSFVECVLSRK